MPLLHVARLEEEGAEQGARYIPLLLLPEELLLAVLAPLSARDLAAALASCKALASLAPAACLAACHYRSPAWAAAARADDAAAAATAAAADGGSAAGGAGVPWPEQLKWMRIREAEEQLRGFWSAAAIRALHADVNERMRACLVEWLIAVSFAWNLDSPIVFKAVEYLDHIMSTRDVGPRARFQLLGTACLRLAMIHAACDVEHLEVAHFVHMAANAFTADELEAQTVDAEGAIPDQLLFCHTSRQLLRLLWRRLVTSAPTHDDMMYIYSLACFLLHLSLLSVDCSDDPPSLLACCALSASLAFFGKPPWPQALQRVFGYEEAQLAPGIERLLHMQATLQPNPDAGDLRLNWERICTEDAQEAQGNGAQWQRLLQLVRQPSRMRPDGAAA